MSYNEIAFRYENGRAQYDSFRLNFFTEGLESAEETMAEIADTHELDRITGYVVLSTTAAPELVSMEHHRDGTRVTYDDEGNAVIPTTHECDLPVRPAGECQ